MLDIKGVYHDVYPKWSIGKSKGCDSLIFVTEGKLIYWVGNKQLLLKKGEALYIPYHIYRAWANHPEEGHRKYSVVFSSTNDMSHELLSLSKNQSFVRMKLRGSSYYEQRFAYLFIQWLGKRPYYKQLSGHVLLELMMLFAREHVEWSLSPVKNQTARKIQEYILSNFSRNITIKELSKMSGLTSNYVTIVFKEVIGSTPIQYLHQTRINIAVHLLEDSLMTVREVAEYLGYCDQAYFNRIFKKWMGVAPSHYREGLLQQN
ncbi:helix-turn-helix domain-containing protein [Pseudogracilibacillus auburnensis]|uniref:helix-turn-helix domain-containing protein n=1 Tax=Pseudogracilibacillus auburnensis TaxID=1494959 RepID=UPI001A975D88|nr:helix-turn-helix domain-containing protein [Pseudogracilibacillus auburnensis]MBO1004002.1 helix-turn-helix transcriptional regulator [Pseudogracilibacillus auburnensis]